MSPVCSEMESLCILSVLCMFVLSLWEESVSEAMSLNSVLLPQVLGAAGDAVSNQRRRRSWVWNQFFVLEEFTGEEPLYVGKLHSDLDKGDGQVRYVLSGEGATSIFTIDENTGDIHATKRLDREQQAYYTLRAQARDRNTNLPVEPESQFIIKVQDINDNEPKFLDGPYTATVSERSPVGTSVVTVVATDADDPTYGNSARLVYSILQGQPYFSVEPKTGVVRTALPDMDREVRDQYLLVIQAKDMIGQMGGLSGTTSVTVTLIDVNDNPPRFPRKSYQFSVPESVLVSAVVAKIKALDLDVGPNAEMDYRILDEDGLGTFRILTDPNTQEGLVILHKTLDFETKSSYTLHVEASNRYVDTRFLSVGPFSDLATVHLLVENVDEPPVFSSSISQMVISEAAAVGTDVGSVTAHDPDATSSPVRFSIDQRSDMQRYFTIDSSSGLIRTNQPLDRETSALHNITVLATESLDPSQVGKAVVLVSVTDINDNAPSFAVEYQLFVCENSKPGQIIETLSAVDRDEPENGHHFLFSLTTEAAGNLNFTLRDNKDNTASVLTWRGGFLQRDQLVHFVAVVISDSGSPSLSSTTTLSVTVCNCDLDGNRRSCSQRASPLLVVGLSTAATAAVLTCVLTLLGVVMVTVVIRHRKREPLMMNDEREILENIVRYDDEGGGEEDTEAFDMFALRHLNQTTQIYRDPDLHPDHHPPGLPRRPQSSMEKKQLFQEFIKDRLQEADLDLTAPPYDSLQTYAFEGSGSTAESLSSLNSVDSLDSLDTLNSFNLLESEQNYDFLREWGPRFRKLADLYGNHKGGEGSS
ncbi:cadherin-7-like [Seriola lalandi dorsalis]|uniref:cadherin-7-like n=1 Tax=Seriola lalandi dorsalis TaxID=1841481 RepID=UPI000C6F5682|nr:cadherin-7-like [Seriola lalandi dorsalis]XP_023254435.1 cadherin-7-like [Seriola lalandi dorsalis]